MIKRGKKGKEEKKEKKRYCDGDVVFLLFIGA